MRAVDLIEKKRNKEELSKEETEYKDLKKTYLSFMDKYLSELEYKINEINYISDKKANVIVEAKGIDFESLNIEKLLDEKNTDNKLMEKLFSKLNEKEIEEILRLDEKKSEEIIIKKFMPYLTEVILEGIDEVKTYRVDKIEFELDKINGKWEIKAEN